jgi:integrase
MLRGASNFLSRDFRPTLVRARLPSVRFHSLRHTFASILASSATPPGAVHRIMRHASFATTEREREIRLFHQAIDQATDTFEAIGLLKIFEIWIAAELHPTLLSEILETLAFLEAIP